MSQEKEYRFIIPIYECEVAIILTDDLKGSRSIRQRKYGKMNLEGLEEVSALSSNEHPYYGLFFTNPITHQDIAHEVFHLVAKLLSNVECKYDPNNHEAYAYLVGWVTKQIYAVLATNSVEIE